MTYGAANSVQRHARPLRAELASGGVSPYRAIATRPRRCAVWASLVYWSKTDTDKIMIVVHDTVEAPLTTDERAFLKKLAGKAKVSARVVRVNSSTSVPIGGDDQ